MQTWMYVSRLRKLPFGRKLQKWCQWACGKLTGHQQSPTEWGYGGGDKADVWCKWCNHAYQIPVKELHNEARTHIYRVTGVDIKTQEWMHEKAQKKGG